MLLIISITIFRCKLNRKQNRKFFAREKIILVQVVIFLLFIVVYAANLVFLSRSQITNEDSFQECHLKLRSLNTLLIFVTVDIAMLILFIYMSVMFSRPLTGYWVEFLLSYRR